MIKNENYIQWLPLENIPLRLVCDSIHDDEEGICIVLREQSKPGKVSNKQATKVLKVLFDPAIAYRNIDESYRSRTFDDHQERIGSLFIVENSRWVSWLHEESYRMYADSNIIHYAFFTLNDSIDVLSEFEPIVEWSETRKTHTS